MKFLLTSIAPAARFNYLIRWFSYLFYQVLFHLARPLRPKSRHSHQLSSLVVFLLMSLTSLTLSVGEARGFDCEYYLQLYDFLEKNSLYTDILRNSENFTPATWRHFLEQLDPKMIYLTVEDINTIIEESRSHVEKEISGSTEQCHSILYVADKVSQKVDEVYREHQDRMLEWALGIHSLLPEHQTYEIRTSTRAKNKQELELRWRQFAVFQRFTANHLNDEQFAQVWHTFHNTNRQRVHEPIFQFRSFMTSLTDQWDPEATIKLQLIDHHNRVYVGSPPDVRDRRTIRYAAIMKHMIGGHFKTSYWYYPTTLKFISLRTLRAPFFHSSYYKPQAGDMLVAQWFDPLNEMATENHSLGSRAIVLRREREKTRWDHYQWSEKIVQHAIRYVRKIGGLYFNENFIRFSYSPTEPLSPIKVEPATTHNRTTAPHSQSRHQPIAPPRRDTHKSVHYISFRQFFGLSDQAFSKELVDALKSLSREDSGSVPTIFLDLRSTPRKFNLHWYLQTLSIFLPNQPVAIMQTASHTNYLRSRTGAFTSSAPLVVLVDHNTKNYAELLAATLQESGRALVLGAGLGVTTFGSQYAVTTKRFTRSKDYPYSLPSTSGVFEATFAQLFTPSGKSYNYEGVRPDITLPMERHVYTRHLKKSPSRQLLESARRVKVTTGSATSTTTESCFAPLPPTLIRALKKRSDQRLLQRTYRRQVERMPAHESAEVEHVYLSFSDAFHRSPEQLASETPLGPCKPECDRVSLNPEDFRLDKALSLQRTTKYLKSLNRPVNAALKKKRLKEVMLEEEELMEALNIALDYGTLVSHS